MEGWLHLNPYSRSKPKTNPRRKRRPQCHNPLNSQVALANNGENDAVPGAQTDSTLPRVFPRSK